MLFRSNKLGETVAVLLFLRLSRIIDILGFPFVTKKAILILQQRNGIGSQRWHFKWTKTGIIKNICLKYSFVIFKWLPLSFDNRIKKKKDIFIHNTFRYILFQRYLFAYECWCNQSYLLKSSRKFRSMLQSICSHYQWGTDWVFMKSGVLSNLVLVTDPQTQP